MGLCLYVVVGGTRTPEASYCWLLDFLKNTFTGLQPGQFTACWASLFTLDVSAKCFKITTILVEVDVGWKLVNLVQQDSFKDLKVLSYQLVHPFIFIIV